MFKYLHVHMTFLSNMQEVQPNLVKCARYYDSVCSEQANRVELFLKHMVLLCFISSPSSMCWEGLSWIAYFIIFDPWFSYLKSLK